MLPPYRQFPFFTVSYGGSILNVLGLFCADLLAAAVGAVAAQLEGRALSGVTAAHVGAAAAHLDLLQGAGLGLTVVIGAAVHRAADAGIGIFCSHVQIPPDKSKSVRL